MYLLDTNVISEIRKINQHKYPSAFKAWFDDVDLGLCYLSVITLFEIERGILQKSLKDKIQADILRHWFNHQILYDFKDRIIALDEVSSLKTASFHVPNPAPLADSFIASTAISYDLILVTRNTKDFIGFNGIQLLNPFE